VEAAASGVVANEKHKQAEEARLEAAKVAAQTKQIEALTFANPALLEQCSLAYCAASEQYKLMLP